LASAINVNVTTSSGSVKLDTIFTTQYLLLDFSQPGCGPCISHAQSVNSSSSEQARFSGSGACKILVIVAGGQLSSWQEAIGGSSTFTGRNSAEYSGGLNGFSRLFGMSGVSSTPTFALVDRTGRVVGQSAGGMPGQVSSLCR
jgi:thioredoxin-related protein